MELARDARVGQLRLREVAVRGHERLTAPQVARAAGLRSGMPLLEVDSEAVEAQLREHPWILRARASRLPPSKLLLEVEERTPVALARIGEAATLYLVDDSGTPFAPGGVEEGDRLPILGPDARARPGHASGALAEGLRIVGLVRRHGLPEAADLELPGEKRQEEGIVLHLRGLAARIVLGADPFGAKLERLVRLLEARLPETAAATSIDLRFADRVVLRSGPFPEGSEAAVARGSAAPPEPDPAG
jgi:cell division protein FtsQ